MKPFYADGCAPTHEFYHLGRTDLRRSLRSVWRGVCQIFSYSRPSPAFRGRFGLIRWRRCLAVVLLSRPNSPKENFGTPLRRQMFLDERGQWASAHHKALSHRDWPCANGRQSNSLVSLEQAGHLLKLPRSDPRACTGRGEGKRPVTGRGRIRRESRSTAMK